MITPNSYMKWKVNNFTQRLCYLTGLLFVLKYLNLLPTILINQTFGYYLFIFDLAPIKAPYLTFSVLELGLAPTLYITNLWQVVVGVSPSLKNYIYYGPQGRLFLAFLKRGFWLGAVFIYAISFILQAQEFVQGLSFYEASLVLEQLVLYQYILYWVVQQIDQMCLLKGSQILLTLFSVEFLLHLRKYIWIQNTYLFLIVLLLITLLLISVYRRIPLWNPNKNNNQFRLFFLYIPLINKNTELECLKISVVNNLSADIFIFFFILNLLTQGLNVSLYLESFFFLYIGFSFINKPFTQKRTFNTFKTSLTLQKNMLFIPGTKLGKPTRNYLDSILTNLYALSQIYLIPLLYAGPIFFAPLWPLYLQIIGSLLLFYTSLMDTLLTIKKLYLLV
uniref:Preprotein translocase subunit SecY n=1 Tax=Chromera velia TaxID=505693 RepID=D9IXF6_9ALVE|nr:preprotein translocase subunit SecY [Chromera velia]ADJ66564.2 preprotein translocase subunit SecY [Chromera velia]